MKTTPLKAIFKHCSDCIYDPVGGNGTKNEQIEACTSYKCALYEFRPETYATKSARNDEKLKSMSKEGLASYKANKAVKAAIFKKRMSKVKGSPEGAHYE